MRPRRRRRWLAAALLLLLGLFAWSWGGEDAPEPVVAALADARPERAGPRPKDPAAKDPQQEKGKAEKPRTVVKPRPAGPPPVVDEAALRAAIASRASELKTCGESGAPERLLARLALTRQGGVKAVTLNHVGPLPATVSSCVREKVRAWRFPELQLLSEVEVVVTFHLSPERTAAASAG